MTHLTYTLLPLCSHKSSLLFSLLVQVHVLWLFCDETWKVQKLMIRHTQKHSEGGIEARCGGMQALFDGEGACALRVRV